MEGGHEEEGLNPAPTARRVAGYAVGGALLGGLLAAAVAMATAALSGLPGAAATADAWRGFLFAGGWLRLPLAGAAAGLLRGAFATSGATARAAVLIAAAAVAALAVTARVEVPLEGARPVPRSTRARTRAILKWSYESPAGVGRVLGLSRDPNPQVREQAVLALGVNVIVTDIERATTIRPSRFGGHPLRDSLRVRLLEVMRDDPLESVRAEAARGLWKASLAFGSQPPAAETLAAMLDRAAWPGGFERLAWMALDAAAGPADSTLLAAVSRFAGATADTGLARVARQVAARAGRPGGSGGRSGHPL